MDALDVRILRAYFQDQTTSPIGGNFRASVAAMAKMLEVNEDVVRHRLKRIQDSGFIDGWRLYLNPTLWGGGAAQVWFEVETTASKRYLVDRLRLIPGMTHVAVFYDTLVALFDFENEASLSRHVHLIRQLTGASSLFVTRDAFPECKAVLAARDWDILRALRRNPRQSYSELGDAARLSAPTAKARLARLLAGGVAFAWPTINMRSTLQGVFMQLLVRYPGDRKPEVDQAVTTRLEPYLWHVLHMVPYRTGELWPCGYNLILPNLSAARQVLDQAKRISGVEDARTYLYEGIVNFFDNYDEELDRRLSHMPTALPREGAPELSGEGPRR